MVDINNLPYAEWLEQSLRNILGKPVEVICIMTRVTSDDKELGDEIGSGYWNCTVADKLLFAGFLQQDAMLDTMKANGYISDEEDTEEDEYNGQEELS